MLETASTNTLENFQNILPWLEARRQARSAVRVIVIASPVQQRRTMANFYAFRRKVQAEGWLSAESRTTFFDTTDAYNATRRMAGELWRLVLYTIQGNALVEYDGNFGLEHIPGRVWQDALEQIASSGDPRKIYGILRGMAEDLKLDAASITAQAGLDSPEFKQFVGLVFTGDGRSEKGMPCHAWLAAPVILSAIGVSPLVIKLSIIVTLGILAVLVIRALSRNRAVVRTAKLKREAEEPRAGPVEHSPLEPRSGKEKVKFSEASSVNRGLAPVGRVIREAWIIPMFNEMARSMPYSRENPNGEDALRAKFLQALVQMSENPSRELRYYFVDDGTPGAASAGCVRAIWEDFKASWVRVRDEYRARGIALPDDLPMDMVRVIVMTPPEKKYLSSRKGGAVYRGFQEAYGDGWAELIGITDLDISTNMLLAPLLSSVIVNGQADVAIGSRWTAGGESEHVPLKRYISSKIFNLIIHWGLPPLRGIEDTQRGFKLFKRAVIGAILPHVQDRGFSWDTEALLLSKLAGARVLEVPIAWFDSVEASTIDLSVEARRMFKSIILKQAPRQFDRRLRRALAAARPLINGEKTDRAKPCPDRTEQEVVARFGVLAGAGFPGFADVMRDPRVQAVLAWYVRTYPKESAFIEEVRRCGRILAGPDRQNIFLGANNGDRSLPVILLAVQNDPFFETTLVHELKAFASGDHRAATIAEGDFLIDLARGRVRGDRLPSYAVIRQAAALVRTRGEAGAPMTARDFFAQDLGAALADTSDDRQRVVVFADHMDIDSFVSAMNTAYLLHCQFAVLGRRDVLVAPVLFGAREKVDDLIRFVFARVLDGGVLSRMCFTEEVDLPALLRRSYAVQVDSTGHATWLTIDHHPARPGTAAGQGSRIEKGASAAFMISQEYGASALVLDPLIAWLTVYSIMSDTLNFTENMVGCPAIYEETVRLVASVLSLSRERIGRLFEEFSAAAYDIHRSSPQDILLDTKGSYAPGVSISQRFYADHGQYERLLPSVIAAIRERLDDGKSRVWIHIGTDVIRRRSYVMAICSQDDISLQPELEALLSRGGKAVQRVDGVLVIVRAEMLRKEVVGDILSGLRSIMSEGRLPRADVSDEGERMWHLSVDGICRYASEHSGEFSMANVIAMHFAPAAADVMAMALKKMLLNHDENIRRGASWIAAGAAFLGMVTDERIDNFGDKSLMSVISSCLPDGAVCDILLSWYSRTVAQRSAQSRDLFFCHLQGIILHEQAADSVRFRRARALVEAILTGSAPVIPLPRGGAPLTLPETYVFGRRVFGWVREMTFGLWRPSPAQVGRLTELFIAPLIEIFMAFSLRYEMAHNNRTEMERETRLQGTIAMSCMRIRFS